jgi:capsular exopolysaccharide synthesis family protein
MNKISVPEPEENDRPSPRTSPAPLYLDRNDLRETVRKVWRHHRLILATMAVITTLAMVSVLQIAPRYTASALIMIDPRSTKVVDLEEALSGGSHDTEAVFSEAAVLTSRQLIGRLVDKLKLRADPEFNGALRPIPFMQKFNPVRLVHLALAGPQVIPNPDEQMERERNGLVDAVLGHLNVSPRPRTRVISISVESENPQTAALIANTLADLYLVDQLETKFEATQRVTSWLNDRLDELRRKVDASERAVEAYRATSGLIGSKGSTVASQEMTELTSQLTIAHADRAAAEAKLSQVREAISRPNGEDSVTEVLDSSLVQHLREQEGDVERSIADLSAQYGERHPKLIAAHAQLDDVRAKIHSEVQKIILNLENSANVARVRESAVAAQMEELKRQVASSNTSEVHLHELEMEATANRTLMETFLSRFKETSAQTSGEIQTPDARIISRADVPMTPSYPKKTQYVGAALFMSALAGLALAFVAESLDRGFRSGIQFEHETSTPVLAMIPLLENGSKHPADYLVDRPLSAYAEAVRSVYTSLLLTLGDEPLKTIVVVSAQPDEGKTTMALSLARMVAGAGGRAVLVEADLRHPSVHEELGLERRIGLAEVLIGAVTLSEAITKDPRSNAAVLLAGKETLNPSKLMASHQMDTLIATLSRDYDQVIIDTAPVLAVSDALLLANQADGTILCCRWAATSRETAHLGLKELREANARIIGAALTMVDMKKSRTYGYADTAYYNAAKKYYTE